MMTVAGHSIVLEDVVCPECSEEAGQATDREALNGGVRVAYECAHCAHEWSVVF